MNFHNFFSTFICETNKIKKIGDAIKKEEGKSENFSERNKQKNNLELYKQMRGEN